MNMCNEYFVIWSKFRKDANHLQNSPVQVHIKVETWQKKTDKIIPDAFGSINLADPTLL
jgi:hypothetical protein